MDQVRPRLEAFAAEMLGGLARSDQRAKGELYLRGLMLDGKRKSMQPMAARLGVDHQQLQQFVSSSTWDHVEVARRVARWADGFVRPDAYVIDDTGFPKDGADSPGVARMYSGSLGKVGNCQIGVSVHAVTDWASAAINWRLFMPKSWDPAATTDPVAIAEIRRRRARCRIPEEVAHREKWRLALDMLDQITADQETGEDTGGWGLPDRPVVADAGYGDITEFRLGLAERGLPYVVAVKGTTSAYPADAVPVTPPYSGRGRPRCRATATTPATSPPWRWPRAAASCAASPGVTAPGRMRATRPLRWRPDSSRCAFARRTATSPAPPTTRYPNAG
jgi:SRSO17 transposase